MNRFTICETYYLFLSSYHEGQESKKYKRLCKLLSYFKPSPLLTLDNCNEEVRTGVETLIQRESLI